MGISVLIQPASAIEIDHVHKELHLWKAIVVHAAVGLSVTYATVAQGKVVPI